MPHTFSAISYRCFQVTPAQGQLLHVVAGAVEICGLTTLSGLSMSAAGMRTANTHVRRKFN